MRSGISLLLIIFFSTNILSQSISPFTFNAGGLIVQQQSYSLTMSTGEAASIINFTSQNGTNLSSGFLQSFSPIITGLDDNTSIFDFNEIKVSPNPTKSNTNISYNLRSPGQVQYQIYSVSSKLLYRSPLYNVNGYLQTKVDLVSYPIGHYYVQVYFKSTDGKTKNGIYKILKL